MTPEQIAPCPFCGGEAVWREDDGRFNIPFGLIVDHADDCWFSPKAKIFEKEDHIAAWNRRLVREDVRPCVTQDNHKEAFETSYGVSVNTSEGARSDLITGFARNYASQGADGRQALKSATEIAFEVGQAAYDKAGGASPELKEIVRLYRDSAKPETAEPVAWMYEYTRKHVGQTKPGAVEFTKRRTEHKLAPYWTETPLYTHPNQTEVVEALEKAAMILARFTKVLNEHSSPLAQFEIDDAEDVATNLQTLLASLKGSRP